MKSYTDHRKFVRAGYTILAVGLGGFMSWAVFTEIASAVVAPGTVVVASNRKVIQHLEGGIIRSVEVTDGQSVRAGDILVRLDQTQALANLEAIQVQYDAAKATEARLIAERMGHEKMNTEVVSRTLPEGAHDPVADQFRLFEMRQASLAGQIDIMDSRIEQLTKKAEGWHLRAEALRSEASNFKEQLEGLSNLVDKGLYPKNSARDLERRMMAVHAEIAEAEAEEASAQSAIAETKLQKEQAIYVFREKASEELAKLRETIGRLTEMLDVARDVVNRTMVRAPQDGVVQSLRFHAKGEVVKPGEPILEIVPVQDELLVEVMIPAQSIDQVRTGAETEIRFPSFSSKETPIILGRVQKVSADAVPDKDGNRQAFLGRVEVLRESIPNKLADRLQPGMPAEAIMTNESRTVMSYLIKPLMDSMSRGMRER